MLVGLGKKKFSYTPPASPSLARLLFLCQPLVLFEQMQKASSKRDRAKKKKIMKEKSKINKDRKTDSESQLSGSRQAAFEQ